MRSRGQRLGELLEERGRLAHDQLLRALRNQKVLGGRLGTCLLEIEAIGEEELLSALSEVQGVPSASPEDLRAIEPEVIATIPAKVAKRCLAIPFHVSSTQVKVAIANARDLAVQDEVSFVVGKRIRWYVATDLRIHEALEKYYGEECPTRYGKLLDRINRSRFLWAREDAEAEAAAPPPVEMLTFDQRVAATMTPTPQPAAPPETPTSTPPEVAHAAEPEAAPSIAPGAGVEDVPPVAPTPPKPVTPPLPAAVTESASIEGPGSEAPTSAPLTEDDTQDIAPAGRRKGALDLGDAEKLLLDPNERDDIARVLLDFAGTRSRRAVMMVVRKQEIAAWMWTGEGLDAPALAAYRATLDEPSIFLDMRSGTELFNGVLAPVRAHRDLLASFEPRPEGGRIVVIPLRVRNRLVAALLFEPLAEGLEESSLAEFRRIAAKAAIAFELCIMRAKLRKA